MERAAVTNRKRPVEGSYGKPDRDAKYIEVEGMKVIAVLLPRHRVRGLLIFDLNLSADMRRDGEKAINLVLCSQAIKCQSTAFERLYTRTSSTELG